MKLKLIDGVSLPATHFSLTVKKKFRKALQEWFFANGFSFFGGSVNYQKKAKHLHIYPFDKTLTYDNTKYGKLYKGSLFDFFEEDTCLDHIKYPNSFLGLPEHWYIQVTNENVKMLNEYLKTHKDRYAQFSNNWYVHTPEIDCNPSFFHSDNLMGAAHSVPNPKSGYAEVTTEMVENYMKKWNQLQSLKLIDKDWIVGEDIIRGFDQREGPDNMVTITVKEGSFVCDLDGSNSRKVLGMNTPYKKFIVEKDVKLGDKYVGDVKFQKSDLLDKSWIELKKESAKKVGEQLSEQNDVNKDGYLLNKVPEGSLPPFAITPDNLTPISKHVRDITEAEKLTKEQIEKYDDFFKSHVGHAIEAGTHKAPDEYVLVKVKVGSLIIDPGFKGNVVGGGFGIKEYVVVGDLKKRAEALEKCEDQEVKPKQEYEKTLENVEKINAFIGLKDANSISHGNKDVIFKKSSQWDSVLGAKAFFYNTGQPTLKYTFEQMLSDWKNNNVKPLD